MQEFLEGEEAVQYMMDELNELTLQKIEFIGRSDLSSAYLIYALALAYEVMEDSSEVSHAILNIVGEILNGSSDGNLAIDVISKSLHKH